MKQEQWTKMKPTTRENWYNGERLDDVPICLECSKDSSFGMNDKSASWCSEKCHQKTLHNEAEVN